MTAAAAFWSYAHEDNELDAGNVLVLASRLRNEFALITGLELTMFVDREGVQWGDEWARRIDGALAETTFFIPVLTPRYFARHECRRELLMFVGRAESLGLKELVLPILYVTVPGLDSDSADEAVALSARMQYADWRELRLLGPESHEYRQALYNLAERLAAVSASVNSQQLQRETAADVEGEAAVGLQELVERIDGLLPDWLAAVEDDPIVRAQHNAVQQAYIERTRRLERANAPHGARLAQTIRQARDLLPIAESHLSYAEKYAARTVELDPLVHAAIRLVEQYPEESPILDPVRRGVAGNGEHQGMGAAQ